MLLYSTNIAGTTNWIKRVSGLGFMRSGQPLATSDGGCLWLGYYWDWNHKTSQDYDLIIHKVNSDGTFFEDMEEPESSDKYVHVFPNPATSYTIIDYLLPKSDKATLNIISNNGNVIWQKELAKTRDQVVVALHGYAKGSYTVSIVSNKKIIATCSLLIVN
jgi:hypothetical protein